MRFAEISSIAISARKIGDNLFFVTNFNAASTEGIHGHSCRLVTAGAREAWRFDREKALK